MGERSALPALIPSGWQDRRGVGRLAWLVLSVIVSIAGITAAHVGDAPPRPSHGLEARAAAPQVVIDWRDGRLSVSVRAATWENLLPALERHTGLQIRVLGPLSGTVTQEVRALSLEQGLRQLFREVNTVFFYAPGPHGRAVATPLTEVWLVPKDGVASPQPRPSPGEPTGTALLAAPDPQRDSDTRSSRQEEPSPAGEAEEDQEEDQEEEAGAEQR
jgi:hypothetical protein